VSAKGHGVMHTAILFGGDENILKLDCGEGYTTV